MLRTAPACLPPLPHPTTSLLPAVDQGRVDGALCDYDDAAKMEFLRLCHDKGVRNIEMESLQFGAFTQAIGAKAGVIAVALLNRFEGDGVLSTPEQLMEFDGRPARVVCALLKARGVGGGAVGGTVDAKEAEPVAKRAKA